MSIPMHSAFRKKKIKIQDVTSYFTSARNAKRLLNKRGRLPFKQSMLLLLDLEITNSFDSTLLLTRER